MKKLLFLPVAAMLLFVGCSDDEPIVIPEAPVKVQQPVADNVDYHAPAQTSNKYERDGSLYVFTYQNGQKIGYEMMTSGNDRIAIVKKIIGTSKEAVVPYTVTGQISETQTAEWTVIGIDPYADGIAENITSLTLPVSCSNFMYNSTIYTMDDVQMRKLTQNAKGLSKIELEASYPGYVSINGAVYTEDMKTLVTVPRKMAGEIAVAEGTETVGDAAFTHCASLTAVTLPASVTAIGKEAFTFCDNLLVLNVLSSEAPVAYADTFSKYLADNGVLRVKKGTEGSYKVARPEVEEPLMPTEPAQPGEEATEEEWGAYEKAMAEYEAAVEKYEAEVEVYDAAWLKYDEKAGYAIFKTIKATLD